jgi:predicted ferric reductase
MKKIFHKIMRRGWIVLLLITLGVPVVSWLFHTTFSDAFYDGGLDAFITLKFIGQLTGIIGAQLFAFALILSARISFLEKLFGGMDKLYVIHHRVGTIAFGFLCVHPIILACRFASSSFRDVANFLSPFGNTWPVISGITAILVMLVLLTVTFYGSAYDYPKLKLAHRFLGLGFFFGFLHILFIPSSLSSDAVLRFSLIITAALGLLAFTYRTLLGKWLVPRYKYSVASVSAIAGQVTEIVLTTHGKMLYHLPGQFGMLSFVGSPVVPNEEHPFTLSSSGEDGIVRFSIKGLGDYTKLLGGLTVGTEALIEGPFGEFSYVYGSEKQVWVAGGIGVTPFVSMAEHLLTLKEFPYFIDFYFSVRTEADTPYKELFEKVAKKFPSFVFHLVPSDTKGFVTGDLLISELKDIHFRDIFICGPPPMMSALIDQLVVLGVKNERIHSERFALLK